jgi:hypothetical protein
LNCEEKREIPRIVRNKKKRGRWGFKRPIQRSSISMGSSFNRFPTKTETGEERGDSKYSRGISSD